MLHDVCISCAREDQPIAAKLYRFLTDRGLSVWFDRALGGARPDFQEIAEALRRSSFVLLLWSKNAREDELVHNAILFAEERGKKIIPIKLDKSNFSTTAKMILSGSAPIDATRGLPEAALSEIARRIAPRSEKDAPVYLLLNMKGGVGKTTLAANIAGTFHAMGRSVLLIDLDAQANLSNLLMSEQQYVEAVSADRSIISCFENSLANGANISAAERLFEVVIDGPTPSPSRLAFNLTNPLSDVRFDLIVGQFELFKFSLAGNYPYVAACRVRFQDFIARARRQYDVVVLDAAPSNSFVTECAMECATDIVAPATPDKYALRGVQAITRLMDGMRMKPVKPVHVLLNSVNASPSTAEIAISRAYPQRLKARVRDSQYFRVRNVDPDARVRDPLSTLAYLRGNNEVKQTLRRVCEELADRNSRQLHV